MSVNDGVASVILPEPCPKNMLGMLGDFLLSVNEFDVVIVAVKQNNGLQLSFRSECQNVDVGRLARETLNNTNRGFGRDRWEKNQSRFCWKRCKICK